MKGVDGVVESGVFSNRHKSEVLNSVILLVPVDVVDTLVWKQLSTDIFLHYDHMDLPSGVWAYGISKITPATIGNTSRLIVPLACFNPFCNFFPGLLSADIGRTLNNPCMVYGFG